MSVNLPLPRGPLSAAIVNHLRNGDALSPPTSFDPSLNSLIDDDLHLALWVCYELHHHGFDEVADDEEWCVQVLAFRQVLESAFEQALRHEHALESFPADPDVAIRVLAERAGPPLASTIAEGTLDQLREFAVHRSAYQLKEADGHTWALPRLRGPARSAMIEIQFDEYGQGVPGQAHSELFAAALRDLGLDDRFGRYVERLPGPTLATDNLVSMFGLNRRLRAALVGHLALFEITSVTPMSKYLSAARRHGDLPHLARFYEVHVEADLHHGDLAMGRMVAHLVRDEPALASDVVFGAGAVARVEARFARHVLSRWETGRSSLYEAPTVAPAPARRSVAS